MKYIIFLLCWFPALIFSQTPKQIYIANDEHTDYFWTADGEAYRQAFLEMLDYYLDLTETTQNEAYEHQSRFNCDGNFWMWVYEKNKSAQEFQRLIDQIKSGHISIPYNALVSCLGGTPAEAVIRGMYYAGAMERKYDLDLSLAVAMENQTLPYGLGALWAGSGAKYSWRGICNCASKVPNAWNREHDIYWWTGPDDSKILMKWNSMLVSHTWDLSGYFMGGYSEAWDLPRAIQYVDEDAEFKDHYPYNTIGIFGYGGDEFITKTDKFVHKAKELSNENRKVIVSNEQDFFNAFESQYGNAIPSVSAGYGNEWDLYCASMAEVSAKVKRSLEKLRSAEAMAAIISQIDPNFMNSRKEKAEQVWMDFGLFWEHDWTADGKVGRDVRAQWQRQIEGEISQYVNDLFDDAKTELGKAIESSPENSRFFVFNQSSWQRSDIADFPYSSSENIHIKDVTTNVDVPWQFVQKNRTKYIRVLAQNIPSLGYKVYEIVPGAGQNFESNIIVSDSFIENQKYNIEFNSNGAITALYDKENGNHNFAGDSYGRTINDLGEGSGSVTIENNGPVSATIKLAGPSPMAHTTRITLYENSDRIELENTIEQNFSNISTWNFAFNLNSPTTRHEEVGAIVKADLTTNGGHYAPVNARYDWLTLNHFVDMSESNRGVTLSNSDCYFMQLGNSTTDYLDSKAPFINVLAGGQIDGKGLGIFAQGGDSYFLQRFALRTHDGYNPTEAIKFALEHQNPLVTGQVLNGSDLPEDKFSFLQIDDKDVLLWALKPAEDDPSQVIARVWNVSNNVNNFTVSTPDYTINNVTKTTHVETPQHDVANSDDNFSASITKQQFQTFCFKLNRKIASVDLLEFGGIYADKSANLSWRTTESNDISGFYIQRSRTNQPFKNVGHIESIENKHSYEYTDPFISNGDYQYRLKIENKTGQSYYSQTVNIAVSNLAQFRLYQNYPNPFNNSTNISFDSPAIENSPSQDRIQLNIYNVNGRKVKTLYDSFPVEGAIDLVWDGTDDVDRLIPSGIYFYKLETNGFTEIKRLLLLK